MFASCTFYIIINKFSIHVLAYQQHLQDSVTQVIQLKPLTLMTYKKTFVLDVSLKLIRHQSVRD